MKMFILAAAATGLLASAAFAEQPKNGSPLLYPQANSGPYHYGSVAPGAATFGTAAAFERKLPGVHGVTRERYRGFKRNTYGTVGNADRR